MPSPSCFLPSLRCFLHSADHNTKPFVRFVAVDAFSVTPVGTMRVRASYARDPTERTAVNCQTQSLPSGSPPHLKILHLITSTKPLHSEVLGIRWTYLGGC